MCYYCGECTATCPRQADPGELMAAARRYAISRYDRLGLARLLYTSSRFNVLFLVLLAIVLGLLLYAFHGPMARDTFRLFGFIPAHVIHDHRRDSGGDHHPPRDLRGNQYDVPHCQRDRRPRGRPSQLAACIVEDHRRGIRTAALQEGLRSVREDATLVHREMVHSCVDNVGLHGIVPGNRSGLPPRAVGSQADRNVCTDLVSDQVVRYARRSHAWFTALRLPSSSGCGRRMKQLPIRHRPIGLFWFSCGWAG